ncbi:MAG: hypothetical protein WC121_05205 [Candidatus Kapaibacterium sp.]|jgi:predicted transcriptional regulator
MESNSSEELKRFKKIFLSTALDKVKFAELFGISPTMINNYLSGVADLQKLSRRLVQMGFSSDWLYSGFGDMHNQAVKTFDPALENELNIDEMNERINEWINKAFISPIDFENETSLEYSLISDSLANSKLLPYSTIKKLKSNGLSYEWAITGSGFMFAENRNGKKLKHRYITQYKGKQ